MYHVAILANLKKNAPTLLPGQSDDKWADLDSESTIASLADALQQTGHRTTFLEADASLIDTLRDVKPDICFNIAEGHHGDAREAQVPALLEMLKIPYTGSRVLTNAISLDKAMTKRVWKSFGLRTAPFQEFTAPDQPIDPEMKYPLFVKPAREGTGAGVAVESIVNNKKELRERVDYCIKHFEQPALVEMYLAGREVTVGVIGNQPRQFVFPPIEVSTSAIAPQERGLYTHFVKAHIDDVSTYLRPANLESDLMAEVKRLALEAHNAINSHDVSRVDIRCDEAGTPYLLEINNLPGMSPSISDLPMGADLIGKGYLWLVSTILNLACHRWGLPAPEPDIPQD